MKPMLITAVLVGLALAGTVLYLIRELPDTEPAWEEADDAPLYEGTGITF
jgi:hypothetical protein